MLALNLLGGITKAIPPFWGEFSRWETEQEHEVSATCHTECGCFYTLAVWDIKYANSRQFRRTLWHLVKIGLTWRGKKTLKLPSGDVMVTDSFSSGRLFDVCSQNTRLPLLNVIVHQTSKCDSHVTLRVVGEDEKVHAGGPSSRAKDGDSLWVSSKVAYVFIQPAQSLDLV